MEKLRIGIIGAGRIGRVHAQSIANYVPGAEVAAISDVFVKAAEDIAKELSIPKVCADYHEILNDPSIDAVLICSPTNTHCDISMEAAAAGKHIFCEKPVDLDPEKIKKCKETVEKAGVKMMTGFNRRFDHNHRRVYELRDSGALGDMRMVRISSRDPEPPSIDYIKISGGLFLDMTIHDFDLARFMAQSEVEEVYAIAGVLVDPAIGEAGDIDTGIISLRFKNGVLGVIDNCRQSAYGYDQYVEVFGSKGSAASGNDCPTNVVTRNVDGVTTDKPYFFFLERYMAAYSEEMKQFIDCIQNDKPVPTNVDDGLQSVLIALAANKSLAEHRPVKLSEFA